MSTPEMPANAVRRDMDRRRRIKLWVKCRRQAIRAGISTWLARHGGTPEPRGQPLTEPPRTILVSRVNKRLGNTLFVTPLVRSLADTFPGASIDLLIMDPAHRRLLAGLPGVREIICVPRTPAAWLGFTNRLRRQHYDLAIDPSVNAVSNRIGISLCRTRHKLGFSGPEQWVRLTHATPVPEHEPHQARQAVHLLRVGIPGIDAAIHEYLEVRPGRAAMEAARERLAAVRNPAGGLEIGFFANATGEKRLPASWWREWAEALQAGVERPRLLQIVPPGEDTGLLPGITAVSFEELDQLAAFISLLDLFVAADSGPMHLAAASGTPTVGLFRATSQADYAPLGRHCLALSVHSAAPSEVAERTLRHLRSLAAA